MGIHQKNDFGVWLVKEKESSLNYFVAVFLFWCATPLQALSQKELKRLVLQTEIDYLIPGYLLDAIIQQESSYRIKAVNYKGNEGVVETSYGLGQLTKDTAQSHCNLKTIKQIYDPKKNVKCAAKVLQYQLNRYKGNINRAVAAYQWGTPCECDGKVYKQKLSYKIRTCKTWHRGQLVPLQCNHFGIFWNQDYVDSVLNRRWKAHINNELFNAFPEDKVKTKLDHNKEHVILNDFDIALLDKFLKVGVSDSLGCYSSFRKKIDNSTVAKDHILNILMFEMDYYFTGYLLANQYLLNS